MLQEEANTGPVDDTLHALYNYLQHLHLHFLCHFLTQGTGKARSISG